MAEGRAGLELLAEIAASATTRMMIAEEMENTRREIQELENSLITLKRHKKPEPGFRPEQNSSPIVNSAPPQAPPSSIRPDPSVNRVHVQPPMDTSVQFMQVANAMEQLALKASLPALDIVKFSGDPCDYQRFMTRYSEMVGSQQLSEMQKMSWLMNFVEGKAKRAISGFDGVQGGLSKALGVLERRFGQPHLVTEACVATLVNGPNLAPNDVEGLGNYADQARCALETLKTMNAVREVNNANLAQMARKLPVPLQFRWRDQAQRLRDQGIVPHLASLVEFIERAADAASDPVFGKIGDSSFGKRERPNIPKNKSSRTYAVQAEHQVKGAHAHSGSGNSSNFNVRKCWDCQGDHLLRDCSEFKAKPVSQRNKLVRNNGLCFNCLVKNHRVSECRSSPRCNMCKGKHHPLLHRDMKEGESFNSDSSKSVVVSATGRVQCPTSCTNKVALQVVAVSVIGRNGKVAKAYALLDSASEDSFVDKALVDALGIASSGSENLNICTMTGESTINVGKCQLEVKPLNKLRDSGLPVPAKIAKQLNISACQPTDLSKWTHMKGINLPKIADDKISILIGANVPDAHIHHETRLGLPNEPHAVRTSLGWSIFGPYEQQQSNNRSVRVNFVRDVTDETQLKQFFEIEQSPEVSTKKGLSVEDKKALVQLDATTTHDGERYEVGMLWRETDPWLPNNRVAAEKRLQGIRRRLLLNEGYAQKYREYMDMLIEKDYARKLNSEEAASCGPKTWYLPHHGVINPQKPDKLRVVFDAAAKFQGSSLNDKLVQGPDLANSLLGVLLRFREHKIAIVGDIAKMFLQVKVTADDSDSLRFLWWRNEDLSGTPEEFQMTRHIFGATDSPSCCNYALKRTADDYQNLYSKDAVVAVKRDCYVDDLCKSVPDTEQAITLVGEVSDMLEKGGFHITKWVSNDRAVLASIPSGDRANPMVNLDFDDLPVQRALGVLWNVENDAFTFQIRKQTKALSKRGVLSTLSSLFDPIGFISPVILTAKNIMQSLWSLELGWDDPLPPQIENQWNEWLGDLNNLTQLSIPRCYQLQDDQISDISLHNFSDASGAGYGMCSYLRFTYQNGRARCVLVASRARCAPTRIVSIPRLELQAAVLSANIACSLQEELSYEFSKVTYWTDSQTVLNYINNESKRFQTYVANRVAAIHNVSNPEQWRHCPGEANPADIASRGMTAANLLNQELWWNGPKFLEEAEQNWPQTKVQPLDGDSEVRKKPVNVNAIGRGNPESVPHSGLLRVIKNCSSWVKLQRIVALAVRFCNGLKIRKFSAGPIESEELDQATGLIVRAVQEECFSEDIARMQNEGRVKSSSRLVCLKPMLIEGALRVGGRLDKALVLSEEERHPLILPSNHHVSNLILRHYHWQLAHAGREQTLAESRKLFWIIRGRSRSKDIIHKCFLCRKWNARVMKQLMAALPKQRLDPFKPAFTYTGVDLFGPLVVKWGRSTKKYWGCIFTCLTTRAVYLDILPSLGTDDFILLLRQFISRRGPPEEMWSDNGSNFTSADKELRECISKWNNSRIGQEMQQRGVKWRLQPPTAAHMSGVWERLVKTSKRHLKALTGSCLLNENGLRTLFAETEAIMNGRPLSPVSDDPQDFEPLTPNHFLLHRKVSGLPPGVFVKEDSLLRREWKKVQYLTNIFWDRWIKEYLPTLQQRRKWFKEQRNVRVGDLVLLAEDNVKRGQWPMGRVTRVIHGSDDLVRSAVVKTATGELHRPIVKMCLLEAAED